MSPTIPVRAVFVSCLMMLSSGAALGGVYECVDPAGATTYTDVPCKDGDDTVRRSAAVGVGGINRAPSPYDRHAEAKQVFKSMVTGKKLRQRGLATDRATLRAASQAMMTIDRVSALEPRRPFSRSY